jgi:anaerobic selenocysteine-containing dehydrogenase
MIDLALNSGHPHLAGITRARLETEGHVRLTLPVPMRAASARAGAGAAAAPNATVSGRKEEEAYPPYKPFAAGFPTPTGRAEFYSESLIAQGLDPVVSFVPPNESRHRENNAKQFPLELLARKCDNYLNSTFSNLPVIQKMEDPNRLEIGRTDADSRGISDGDRVRVFNSRGEIYLTATVDGKVPAGVVAASLNWAKLTPGGRNINVLTSDRLADMGGGPTFYSVLVQVEKA